MLLPRYNIYKNFCFLICVQHVLSTKAGFPKIGHDSYSGGHEQQSGKTGAMNSKGAIGDHKVIIF